MGVWGVTGWPVAGLIAVAAVAGLPPLLTTSVASAGRITRLEALEDWTRRLADVLTVGVGLEQAIAASLRTAPAAIAPQVAALAARLGARWPTEAALRAFADDLDDATGDLVAAALILGSRRRGPGLGAVLDGLAGTVAEEVSMRRKVEADRARPRTTARWVTLITLGVVGLGALNGTYIRPYGSGLGQLVLAALALAFAGALVWMRAISAGTPEPRFLPGPGEASAR
jgi:Flp pilus assembly protein TadB